jgi:creatinine amidohydrolase
MENRLEALTSPEIKERIESGVSTAVFPTGSLEQHGFHCPIGTDTLIAKQIATGVANRLEALCLPPLWFGVSPHHMDFAGSLTIRPSVFAKLMEDVLESLIHHGIKNVLILNGHGGNTASIDISRTLIRSRYPEVFTALSSVWVALNDVYDEFPPEIRQENWRTMIAHGGLFETSVVMSVEEGMVKLDQARPVSVDKYVLATDPALNVTVSMKDLSETGSNGDPSGSSPELGQMFVEKSVEIITEKYLMAKKVFAHGE